MADSVVIDQDRMWPTKFSLDAKDGSRFASNWLFYKALTGISFGIFNQDFISFRKGFLWIYEDMCNDVEKTFPMDEVYLKEYMRQNNIRLFFSCAGKFAGKILVMYTLSKDNESNCTPTKNLPDLPVNWPWKEGEKQFLADLIQDENTKNQQKKLKSEGIHVITQPGKSISDALLDAFPQIREFSLQLPEVVGAGGISPIDEILTGEIKPNTLNNLDVLCRRWQQQNNRRNKGLTIKNWSDVEFIECLSEERLLPGQTPNDDRMLYYPYLRFHLKDKPRTIDITFEDLEGCSIPTREGRMPSKTWNCVLKAVTNEKIKRKEKLTDRQKFNVNESFRSRFHLKSQIIKNGKLAVPVDISKVTIPFWRPVPDYLKYVRDLRKKRRGKKNISSKEGSENSYMSGYFDALSKFSPKSVEDANDFHGNSTE